MASHEVAKDGEVLLPKEIAEYMIQLSRQIEANAVTVLAMVEAAEAQGIDVSTLPELLDYDPTGRGELSMMDTSAKLRDVQVALLHAGVRTTDDDVRGRAVAVAPHLLES